MRLNSPTFRKKKVEFEHKRMEHRRELEREQLLDKRRMELTKNNKRVSKVQALKNKIKIANKQEEIDKKLLAEVINEKKQKDENDLEDEGEEDDDRKGLRRYFSKQINEQTRK